MADVWAGLGAVKAQSQSLEPEQSKENVSGVSGDRTGKWRGMERQPNRVKRASF